MRIVLAGGESWWQTFARYGIRYILLSYHYLRGQRDFAAMVDWMREAKQKGHPDGPYHFMLDSGAFTFQQSSVLSDLGKPLDDYADEYIRFLRDDPCIDLFDNIAELDVYVDDPITGLDANTRVAMWGERITDVVGSRMMPVIHQTHGPDDWAALAADPRYTWIGIASAMSGDLARIKRIVGIMHAANKRVHIFGMTRMQTDMKWLRNVDSVDSTTWLRADKYGGTFIYHRGFLRILNHLHKEQRAFYRGYFRRLGLDDKKILGTHMPHADHCPGPNSTTPECDACRDQLHELRASSLIAWREMTIRFDRMKWGRAQHWEE